MKVMLFVISFLFALQPVWAGNQCLDLFNSKAKSVSSNVYSDLPSVRVSGGRHIKLGRKQFGEKDYDKVISKIKPGDQIKLPSGREHKVQAILGQGDLTLILDVGQGRALRIPVSNKDDRYQKSIDGFFKMHHELSAEGIPVVELNTELSEPPYAVVVKKENFLFTAETFFASQIHKDDLGLSKNNLKEIYEKFYMFMDSTWRYIDINDVTPRNIGWNGKEWILFDFFGFGAPGHLPIKNLAEKKVAMHNRKIEDDFVGEVDAENLLPKFVEKEATLRVNEIRKKMSKKFSWFERSEERTNELQFVDRATPRPIPKGWVRKLGTNEGWFERDLQGFTPRKKKVDVQVLDFKQEKDGFSIYTANIDDKYSAKVWILNKETNQSYKNVKKIIRKLREAKKMYFGGNDFVVVYDDVSIYELNEIGHDSYN